MSRLEVPLESRILFATGDVLLRAELDLELKDDSGVWRLLAFRVDSGTEMTTVPAFEAKRLCLSMPQRPAAGATHAQTGLEIRSGFLRFRVLGMDQTEYAVPCFFLGDPATPPPNTPPAAIPRLLLGLSGVVDKLRLFFDGTPAPGAPHGNLVVDKK